MTFIHIYPDSMDPCEEEEGGWKRRRVERRVVMFPLCSLAAFLKQIFAFTQEEVGEETSQAEQGKGIQEMQLKTNLKKKNRG